VVPTGIKIFNWLATMWGGKIEFKTRVFRREARASGMATDASRLSHMRYGGGVTSYLEVLTNETNYFSAELGLVQAQLNELLALVRLYRGLGGGWAE